MVEVDSPAVLKKNGKQTSMADFLSKPTNGTKKAPAVRKASASKPAPKSKAAPVKKKIESDDVDDDLHDVPRPPSPKAPLKRAARATTATAKSKYVEISSGDEDDNGSDFEDFD